MATFVALQCFQCNTMQVKQQPKKSNKWSCAICNEKQSVRKVFARSGLAKDIRKFVQDFNMSRQVIEARGFREIDDEEQKALVELQEGPKQSRWSEYLITEEEECAVPVSVSDAYDNVTVVTALPVGPSGKRRQIARRSDGISSKSNEIPNRGTLDDFGFVRANGTNSRVETKTLTGEMKMSQTTAYECRPSLAGLISQAKKPRCQTGEATMQDARNNGKLVSKWASYLEAEDEMQSCKDWSYGGNGTSFQGSLKSELTDQEVDEEVHPDFL